MGKVYRNQHHGFEIELPEMWRGPSALIRLIWRERNPSLRCGPGEAFNFGVGALVPEPALQETEREFADNASSRGYTHLEFGRITVERKEHIWARYRMPQGLWTKKYMVVLDGVEYCMTASATNRQWFEQREAVWDRTVATLDSIKVYSVPSPQDISSRMGDAYAKL